MNNNNYKVQDIECCRTCEYGITNSSFPFYCNMAVVGWDELDYTGICDKYEKEIKTLDK